MTKTFSVGECFSVGWAKFKEHAWFLAGTVVLMYGSMFFFTWLTEDYYYGIEPTRSVIDFLSSLFLYWLCFGMTVVAFKIIDGKSYTWKDLFLIDKQVIRYFLGSFLYGLVVGLGFLAFIIPGIYLSIRYGFFWYAIIDGRKGVFESFHESARITDGVKWNLVLFGFAAVGSIILGVLFFGVGLLVAVPVVMLSAVHLYRVLLRQSMTEPASEVVPPTPSRPVEPNEAPVVVEPAPLMTTSPETKPAGETTSSN